MGLTCDRLMAILNSLILNLRACFQVFRWTRQRYRLSRLTLWLRSRSKIRQSINQVLHLLIKALGFSRLILTRFKVLIMESQILIMITVHNYSKFRRIKMIILTRLTRSCKSRLGCIRYRQPRTWWLCKSSSYNLWLKVLLIRKSYQVSLYKILQQKISRFHSQFFISPCL